MCKGKEKGGHPESLPGERVPKDSARLYHKGLPPPLRSRLKASSQVKGQLFHTWACGRQSRYKLQHSVNGQNCSPWFMLWFSWPRSRCVAFECVTPSTECQMACGPHTGSWVGNMGAFTRVSPPCFLKRSILVERSVLG